MPVKTKDGVILPCILELSELVLNTNQEHFFVGILTVGARSCLVKVVLCLHSTIRFQNSTGLSNPSVRD